MPSFSKKRPGKKIQRRPFVFERKKRKSNPLMAERIMANSQFCTGCRACELACGFHWTKQMNPYQAAITVLRDERTGRIQIEIASQCNVCSDLEVPLCIQVCTPGALSLGREAVRDHFCGKDPK